MTKETSAGTSKDHDDIDPFSLQKQSSSMDVRKLQPSAKSQLLEEGRVDAAPVVFLASNSVKHAMESAQVPTAVQRTIDKDHSQPVLLPEAPSRNAPDCSPSSALLMPQDNTWANGDASQDLCPLVAMFSQHDIESIYSVRGLPATAHMEEKGEVAGGAGLSSHCNVNGPPAAPVSAQEIGAGGSHEHVPYPPAGWFGPPGSGSQFQGYLGPPFFNQYNAWGMFPNMNHARQGGATAPQPGRDGGSLYDQPGFYFGGQPFAFLNGYPGANMSNMPGTSDGAAQDAAFFFFFLVN